MGVRSKARQLKGKTKNTLAKVPGPSTNPATNLIILDVAMRGAAFIASRGVEKALLRTHYQREKAADIVKGRSFLASVTATSAARMATRSMPGFLLVAGGLLAKAAFDRSTSRRQAQRKGERQLAKQAERADD
ncbi:MAG TPA: hypothetical protein VNR60_05350 [Croceibacterium sp.]|nr:hypothetical protein [Croceibacterium sp.]